jgi:glycogen debranching enzyme
LTTATADCLVQLRLRAGDIQISRGRSVLVSSPNGLIGDDPRHGLFVFQTRLLGRYRWLMNRRKPEFSCGSNIDQHSWMGYYIQAPKDWKETPAQEDNPLQQTIELRLKRFVGEGMHEDVQLTNHTQVATDVRLELEFTPEFRSPEEAADKHKQHGSLSEAWRSAGAGTWELSLDYLAKHRYDHQGDAGESQLKRGLTLRIFDAGSEPRYAEHRIRFDVHLQPHEVWSCCFEWQPSVQGEELPVPNPHGQPDAYDRKSSKYLSEISSFKTAGSHDLRNVVTQTATRAALDLCELQMFEVEAPDAVTVAAGIPTYMGVFGRDLLASAWQASLLGPELALGSLCVLKKHQATKVDEWRDAEPGRIVHEMHADPLSVLNFRPKSLYYGSVSGSWLYPILVSELWHWTGNLETVRPFIGPAFKALKWADKHSLDETGFYRYQTRSNQGMKNQGWKDSNDAIVYPDGSQVATPIGTCEMQGFAYAAKQLFSEVLWWIGEISAASQLYKEATELKERFNELFWIDEEGTFAMGIDNQGELIRSVASDPGHCLLSGIVDQSRVMRVASRLLRKDMFSGWGVRTLSAEHVAYNPFSYHRGSVWPVENGNFVLAMARYGLLGEMHQLARALFETAQLFPHCRLPETLGGHERSDDSPFPGLYTKADWPQAWSASAVMTTLRAILGLFPYGAANLLVLDPHLPEWLPELTLENLRVGNARCTIRFERNSDGSTDYKVGDVDGKLHVVRQASPWSLTAGWAERVKDAFFSLVPGH